MTVQHRRRTVLAAAVAAGMLMSLTPAVAQATTTAPHRSCRAVALPAPAGTLSTVTGGDPSGRYLVGQVTYPDVPRQAGALWRHGRYSEIDASSLQNVQVNYHDVNRNGVVAGERMTDHNTFHTDAFTYHAGTFTLLPALRAGESTEALGINARGDVVGNSIGNGTTPVVWPADRPGTVRALPLPDGQPASGRALGIDEDGAVVGHLAPYPPGTPYLWPARGTPHPLPLPSGSVGGDAVAIQRGMVAGNVYDPATNATAPTLWHLRAGGVMLFTAVSTGALSVNRWGTIGAVGALVHANGRVSTVDGRVTTVADTGVAAGSTGEFDGQAVRWFGC
jgi:uncharacterized membrane protein